MACKYNDVNRFCEPVIKNLKHAVLENEKCRHSKRSISDELRREYEDEWKQEGEKLRGGTGRGILYNIRLALVKKGGNSIQLLSCTVLCCVVM